MTSNIDKSLEDNAAGPPLAMRTIVDATALSLRLRPVLSQVAYPANKWELTMTAESYGADFSTRTALRNVPQRTYQSPHDVIYEVSRRGLYIERW